VVAHRGASDLEPEHTLAAYRRAVEMGVGALECDVRLTADGHLVCVHDRSVNRTSNGTGLVSTLELAQLQGLDWGSWKTFQATVHATDEEHREAIDADEPDVVEPGDRAHLLTLRRLLGLVADSAEPLELAIETKHPTRYGGLVERTLIEVLNEFGWARPGAGRASPVRVMSFSLLALRRVRHLAPALPRLLLMDRLPIGLRDGGLPPGVDGAAISIDIVRAHPEYPARLHERGHRVHVWTVDGPDDVQRCLDAGVDALITNRPGAVIEQLTD
jgi:glycerophosphoryl diester phosphodiesterase